MGLRLIDGPISIWDSNDTLQPFEYHYRGTFQVKLISTKLSKVRTESTDHVIFTVTYHQSPLKPESVTSQWFQRVADVKKINIDTTKDHIYYKQWQFNTSEYLNISLRHNNTKTILRNEYPDHCYVGGFIIKENATYKMLHGQYRGHVSSTYGPYCRRTKGEPLINAINSWIFPRGVHHIVVYSYGRLFDMKMTLLITKTPCEPATDVCIR